LLLLTAGVPRATRVERSANRNQDTTLHIEDFIEQIPAFARAAKRLNSPSNGDEEEQRQAVVPPALAGAVSRCAACTQSAARPRLTLGIRFISTFLIRLSV
jgi:hypothetical protein